MRTTPSVSNGAYKSSEKCQGLTGAENADNTDPREPGDLSKSLNAAQTETSNSSNSDEDRCASAVGRKSIQGCRDTQHTGTSDENPVQGECDTEELVAKTSEELATNVVDTVDIRVVHLEYTDDVVGPTRHSSDDQNDNHTGDQAEAVEDGRNG